MKHAFLILVWTSMNCCCKLLEEIEYEYELAFSVNIGKYFDEMYINLYF